MNHQSAQQRHYTIKFTDRQLKETLRAVRASTIDERTKDEVTQKLGLAFVSSGQHIGYEADKIPLSPERLERRRARQKKWKAERIKRLRASLGQRQSQ